MKGVKILACCLCLTASLGFAADKVLRTAFPAPETGFDPVAVQDLYSQRVNQAIFDTLYTYDYLARPVELAPRAAAALPQISADGTTYTIRIKPGIYFSPDPAFGGKKRELVAADFVYSWKRLVDPKVRSPNAYFIEGLVAGLDEYVEQAQKSGGFDYDHPVAGLYAADKYTLVIRLKERSYTLGYILAHTPFSAVAREVVEKYGEPSTGRTMDNPVGSGPYFLKSWSRLSKIVLEKNPYYRDDPWQTSSQAAADQPLIRALSGKKMPIIPRVEINIMEEDQSRFLAFTQGQLDIFTLEGPLAPKMIEAGKLKPEYEKFAYLSRIVDPEISYYQFLIPGALFGGMEPAKIAFRRAVFMAIDNHKQIKALVNDQALAADYPIPDGVAGHQPNYRSTLAYDPAAANQLLDHYGYKIGADGFRTFPDGAPLVLTYTGRADSSGRRGAEFIDRSMAQIKVRVAAKLTTFPEMLKGFKQCAISFFGSAWVADYPDGENFMQLIYGKNAGKSNNGCGVFPDIDALFEASQKLPPGAERDRLYLRISRLAEYYGAWKINYSRYRNVVANQRVIGYRKHPILNQEWMYFDIKE